MPTLTLGAVLAALTNLLYADLAAGGAHDVGAVSDAIGFTWRWSRAFPAAARSWRG